MEQEPQQYTEKFVRNLVQQREAATTQVARLASMLEEVEEQLEAARAQIGDLERRVAEATPRDSGDGKDSAKAG